MREKGDSVPWFSRWLRRREAGSPPAVNTRVTAELSPYSPLPAIGSRRESSAEAASAQQQDRPPPPPLVRQDTYVVRDPLVVKGPSRRRKRNRAWGMAQPPKNTSGGTCFTVSLDKPTEESTQQSEVNAPTPVSWTTDSGVRLKANAQAYWLQC